MCSMLKSNVFIDGEIRIYMSMSLISVAGIWPQNRTISDSAALRNTAADDVLKN